MCRHPNGDLAVSIAMKTATSMPDVCKQSGDDAGIRTNRGTLDWKGYVPPCGSLCTWGGCYIFGMLPSVTRYLISPANSCFVCNEGL